MVAVWSRRWGRECFCKTLRSEGGKLLQNSRGRGPYLLQIDTMKGIKGTYSCHRGTKVPCGKCISCAEFRDT